MTTQQQAAVDKLHGEKVSIPHRAKQFLHPYVRDALCGFVEQSPAFAEAVLQKDKTLTGCLTLLKTARWYAAGFEVYRECVAYFMPSAIVEYKMQIRVPVENKQAKLLELRLEDFIKL